MKTQYQKAQAFRALHERPGLFVTPNPWDRGSAILLEQMGFQALATTGAGFAFSCGAPDNSVGLDRILMHLREVSSATQLPVSADLENGYAHTPQAVARTISRAAEAGVVGGSIEDSTGSPQTPLYPFSQAVERVHAAVEAALALPFPFTLTARAENYFCSPNPDLDDVLRRLQAYEAVGADVLFAPGIRRLSDLATLVQAVHRPVNVMMGFPSADFGLKELADLGVKRVSLGGSLARTALGAVLRAGEEVLKLGTFSFADQAIPNGEMNARFANRAQQQGEGGCHGYTPYRTRSLLARLLDLLARHPPLGDQRVTHAMLKDLGLSRNDIPAIRTGRFVQDETRRQR